MNMLAKDNKTWPKITKFCGNEDVSYIDVLKGTVHSMRFSSSNFFS
jgi:hypothetical protein